MPALFPIRENATARLTVSDHSGHLLLEGMPKRAAGDRQGDRHLDIAAADLDVADHVEVGDRAPQLGVDHLPERLQDPVAVGSHRLAQPISRLALAARSGAAGSRVSARSRSGSATCAAVASARALT